MADPTTDPRPSFVSLGMVVLDELRCPGAPTVYDVPGGSGAFSVLGARLVAGEERAADVGCIILAGNDFPDSALDHFKKWAISLVLRADPTRQSTRGLLEYKDSSFSSKTFSYTTLPLQPSPADLPPHFLDAASFHILARPAEVEAQAGQLLTLRSRIPGTSKPLLVWEPAPPFCNRHTREAHMAAARLVDVFSPNHLELIAFFQDRGPSDQASVFDRRLVEGCADAFLDAGVGPAGSGTVVVRAGGHGCLVASTSGGRCWLPPFYENPSKVVDATGAGNTFLGAFTFAVAACGKDAVGAARLANVAASFAVDQVGLPRLGVAQDLKERWNDTTFEERCRAYDRQQGTVEEL